MGKTGHKLLTREERLAMDPPREGSEGAVEVPQVAADLPPSTRTARSARGRILVAVALVATLVAGVNARLFVFPPSDTPAWADAVVMLSGDHGERLPRALALMRAGVARTLVHDGEPDSAEAKELCQKPQTFEVVCLHPEPDNTGAEAVALGRLALNRDWKTLVVVTSTQHAARAGLLFRRCVSADIHMVPARPAFAWRLTARLIGEEWVKLAYLVTVDRGC
ncbi:MAG TPA: ElyC/SanA/YdcF family protein [Acidimicrobiales bacterium]|nr:ElyC/SanA/YdcF family protein [Acidimicrobiales bacterium]